VVFKVQYPGIDEVIAADMKNLKGMLFVIFSMFTKMDLEPVWKELNDRLLEELDYEHEAWNMKQMTKLYKNIPELIIPEVIDDMSSKHVLCMTLVEGISPQRACSVEFSQEQKNLWGVAIFKMITAGLFSHKLLHVDPNFANFSFLSDGSIIIYDFGCVKQVPLYISNGYAKVAFAVFNDDIQNVPKLLKEIGVKRVNGDLLPVNLIKEYADVLITPFLKNMEYQFGKDNFIYDTIIKLGTKNWEEAMTISFPKDVVFIDRTFGGHFGNLSKLKAKGNWREFVEPIILNVLENH